MSQVALIFTNCYLPQQSSNNPWSDAWEVCEKLQMDNALNSKQGNPAEM